MDGVTGMQVKPTEAFDRHTIYTFRRGPNAGRELKYIGPGVRPFEDMVHVGTADGKPFTTKFGANENTAVCYPDDLVPKV